MEACYFGFGGLFYSALHFTSFVHWKLTKTPDLNTKRSKYRKRILDILSPLNRQRHVSVIFLRSRDSELHLINKSRDESELITKTQRHIHTRTRTHACTRAQWLSIKRSTVFLLYECRWRVLQPFIKHTGDVIDFLAAGFLLRFLLLLVFALTCDSFPSTGHGEIINETTESRDLTFVRSIDRVEYDGDDDGRFVGPLIPARFRLRKCGLDERLGENCIASKRG